MKNIGSILKIGSGRDYKHLNFGNIPVYGTGGRLTFVDKFLYDGISIGIGRKGTIDKPVLLSGKFWTVDTLFYTHSFNKVKPEFLFSIFQKIKWKKYNEASGVPSLSKTTIEKIKVNIPSLSEQKKIASFIGLINDRVSTQRELIRDYKLLKKGLMKKVFNQEIRFKDENESYYSSWKEKTIENIGVIFNGLNGKTKDDFGTGKRFVQYKQVFDNSKVNISDCGFVDIKPNEKQNRVIFGDVFFTTSSETSKEIATSSIFLSDIEEVYLNSFCFGYRYNHNILNPFFAQHLFRSDLFRQKVIPLAQGSTRYNISKKSFLKLKIILPSIEEQQKTAKILSTIDHKITVETNYLEELKEQKQYLLQNIFA